MREGGARGADADSLRGRVVLVTGSGGSYQGSYSFGATSGAFSVFPRPSGP